ASASLCVCRSPVTIMSPESISIGRYSPRCGKCAGDCAPRWFAQIAEGRTSPSRFRPASAATAGVTPVCKGVFAVRRGVLWAVMLTSALVVQGGGASAQYGYPVGYGAYGWGGWGGGGETVQGSIARGLGVFAAGAGQYNQQTAIANSINTDTVMRW